ncbi:MAG: phosphotransferase family protein [Bacteroidetes bacterium]|nr:MAG: phosphotransferase family protein [Bacteroidota bacterium]
MDQNIIDQAQSVRSGENINTPGFLSFINEKLYNHKGEIEILQFPGGYSNLTYLIKKGEAEFVLRKPPRGANIKSAHDMGREFKVLNLLKPIYNKIPEPLFIYDNEDLLGAPFYVMERVKGLILRNQIPKGLKLNSESFRQLSINTIENLAQLHNLNIETTGLKALGKPEGYIIRQVEGWVKRYFNAETDQIPAMNETADWMKNNIPDEVAPALIHNDYKYDNLVLDPESLEIKALLDWEMATVGDPLMDLGTSLGYWAEPDDHPALKAFGLTHIEGNLTRQEVVELYGKKSGRNIDKFVFYYVFGSFKIAVIAQQIYARFKKGLTKDPRFANLIFVTRACADNAANAIKYNRINNFK